MGDALVYRNDLNAYFLRDAYYLPSLIPLIRTYDMIYNIIIHNYNSLRIAKP